MLGKPIRAVFWMLVAVFVFIACVFFIPPLRELIIGLPFIVVAGVVLLSLGVALIFLSVRGKTGGLLKKFLILTGASASGLFISILLHNLFYGLFIKLFGADFWDRTGLGDESFFFIIAVLVCPVGFMVGVVGSIVLFVRGGKQPVVAPPEELEIGE